MRLRSAKSRALSVSSPATTKIDSCASRALFAPSSSRSGSMPVRTTFQRLPDTTARRPSFAISKSAAGPASRLTS
jgi:hypothetical protein